MADARIAVFELENHRSDDRVGYSLWKVLRARAELRVVFTFAKTGANSQVSGHHLPGGDRQSFFPPRTQSPEDGETVLVIGRPGRRLDGHFLVGMNFKMWKLDRKRRSVREV